MPPLTLSVKKVVKFHKTMEIPNFMSVMPFIGLVNSHPLEQIQYMFLFFKNVESMSTLMILHLLWCSLR